MRKQKISWLVVALAILSFSIFAAPTSVLADSATTDDGGFNLTLSPLPISLIANPGQTVTTPLRVENTGTKPVRIKVSAMKFKADAVNGKPDLIEPTAQDEYIKWASFSQTSFTAIPGVYNTITMTIKVPKTAAFGYYYAAVFSEDNSGAPATPANKINGAVASLILLDVQAPGEKRQLQVTSFQATHKVYQFLPAAFNIKVHNSGNVHVVPSGNIFIGRNAHSNFIDTLVVNAGQGNVLPDSDRVFTVDWGNGFPNYTQETQNGQIISDKDGKPIEKLSWSLANADKFRIGRYVASLTLVYNDGKVDVPINGQVVFWVIPWIPILIIVLILTFLGVGLWVFIRTVLRRVKHVRQKRK